VLGAQLSACSLSVENKGQGVSLSFPPQSNVSLRRRPVSPDQ